MGHKNPKPKEAVTCLKCQKPFMSYDRTRNRICQKCKDINNASRLKYLESYSKPAKGVE